MHKPLIFFIMRNFFLVLFVIGILSQNLFASNNEETNKPKKFRVETGVIFAPQGSFSLTGGEETVGMIYPFYAAASLKFKGLSVTPCYEFTGKAASLFIEQTLDKKYELLTYAILSVGKHESYYGLGFGKGLKNGSILFVELGSITEKFSPKIFLGVSIPFMIEIFDHS